MKDCLVVQFIWFLLKAHGRELLYIVNTGYIVYFLALSVGGVSRYFFNEKNVPWLKKRCKTLDQPT